MDYPEADEALARVTNPAPGLDERRAVLGAAATTPTPQAPALLESLIASHEMWCRYASSLGEFVPSRELAAECRRHRDALAAFLRRAGVRA